MPASDDRTSPSGTHDRAQSSPGPGTESHCPATRRTAVESGKRTGVAPFASGGPARSRNTDEVSSARSKRDECSG